VERPKRTLAERARCMLAQDCCCAMEHATGVLRATYHSAIKWSSSLCMVKVDTQSQGYAHMGMSSARTWSQSQEI
jgi:hypothetical protein